MRKLNKIMLAMLIFQMSVVQSADINKESSKKSNCKYFKYAFQQLLSSSAFANNSKEHILYIYNFEKF